MVKERERESLHHDTAPNGMQLCLAERMRRNWNTHRHGATDWVLGGLDFSTDLNASSKQVSLFKPLWLLVSLLVKCKGETKQFLKKSKMTLE